VSHKPLVSVSGLTVADYILWNWSLNSNHDVLALVSGLTLPPLAVGWLWLLALTVIRAIALSAWRPSGRTRIRISLRAKAPGARERQRRGDGAVAATSVALEDGAAASAAAGASSRKLAA
jgi:hypothetical protein